VQAEQIADLAQPINAPAPAMKPNTTDSEM